MRPVRAALIFLYFYSCPYRARCSVLYPFTQGDALGYGSNWAFSPHCMSFDTPSSYICKDNFELLLIILFHTTTYIKVSAEIFCCLGRKNSLPREETIYSPRGSKKHHVLNSYPFAVQKDSFWLAKGLLLKGKRARFEE